MAFFDWNRDGKKDFTDDYIEYNIYISSQGDSQEEYYSNTGNGGDPFDFIYKLIKVALVVVVLVILVNASDFLTREWQCIVKGCNCEVDDKTELICNEHYSEYLCDKDTFAEKYK